jgi:predicted XRE-type DNA-binding protein
MKRKIKSTKSSGNVFRDLGLPNADEHLIKANIALAISGRIKAKGLTQAEVSKLIGLAQPDVSKLLRGHFTGYSFERLFGFLTALGENVKIAVSPAKTKKQARLELELARI